MSTPATITCPSCKGANVPDSRFCRNCGRSLANVKPPAPAADPNPESTVRWSGKPLPIRTDFRRATPLDALFKDQDYIILGRAPECELCLPHPMVSRHHASLERRQGKLILRDLRSINGVFVNGRRVTEPVALNEREQVGIGPFLFSLSSGVLLTVDNSRGLRLESRALEKIVGTINGKPRKLLDNVNLVIEPGEFVSLLGPSGSGKSTLMDCLNGRRRATGGLVLANGEDFYRHFDSFRQSLGYVPQRDIVHTQLTVSRALYYTARLRLPTDTGPTELTARVEEVLQLMELGPHRDTLIGNLSGGQIKRVSLGAELLARPSMLYIDEATSGLDAGTEARMMRLFRQLADEGKSLICITHNVDHVDRCHLVLVLARGKVIFFGPPREAPPYFGVNHISEIYDRLLEKDVDTWEREYRASTLHEQFVAKRLAQSDALSSPAGAPGARTPWRPTPPPRVPAPPAPEQAPTKPPRPPFWHQFRTLTSRYTELMAGDRRSLRLLFLQAPIVALFILAGFAHKPYEQRIPARPLTEQEYQVLLVLDSLNQTADASGKENEKLTKLHVEVEGVGGRSDVIDGVELRRRLQEFRTLPPNDPQRAALDKVRLRIETGNASVPIDYAKLLALQEYLHETGLTSKLLEAHELEAPVVPGEGIIDPRYSYMLLFIVVIVVLWFGCNNAAKEIVKEEAVYGRERAVNLGILPYLGSKFLVLTVMTAAQALFLMMLVFGTLQILKLTLGLEAPPAEYCLSYPDQFLVLTLLSMTGVALGLLLSACVANPDRANALLPYVLIPQIILGGGIMPIRDGILWGLAAVFSPVYWAYRTVHLGVNTLPRNSPYHMSYHDTMWLGCGVLIVETLILLALTAWFLRRKDVTRA